MRADVVAEGQGEVGDILLRATGGDVDVAGAVRTGDNGKIRDPAGCTIGRCKVHLIQWFQKQLVRVTLQRQPHRQSLKFND